MSDAEKIRKGIEEYRKGSLEEKIAAVFMVTGGFGFSLSRGLLESPAGRFIAKLPLQEYLSNPALLAVGCVLVGIPIYGSKYIGHQVHEAKGGPIGALTGGIIVTLFIWFPYFQNS